MGWLPQKAGSPCLNGGGTAVAVPPGVTDPLTPVPSPLDIHYW